MTRNASSVVVLELKGWMEEGVLREKSSRGSKRRNKQHTLGVTAGLWVSHGPLLAATDGGRGATVASMSRAGGTD